MSRSSNRSVGDDAPHRLGTLAALAAFVVAAALVVGVSWWLLIGGRWLVVETPSMGTVAPVGTLLWVEPTPAADLHVGDLVTFRPPGSAQTYTHRIHSISSDGTITTKGAITPVDPWRLHASDVVGRVVARWWGVGWLVRAAPVLVIGALAISLLIRLTPRRWRQPTMTTGAALVLAIAVVIYRPLTGAVTLSTDPLATGGGRASFVSTGLLPLRVQAGGGGSVRLTAGEVGTLETHHLDAHGHYALSLAPDVPWWAWAVLIALCFVPALRRMIWPEPRVAEFVATG